MPTSRRGEVWLVDLGLAAKVRPCLILTDFPGDEDLALVTVVAHTTVLRGSMWEVPLPKAFLARGAFQLQQIHSIPVAKLERRLGFLTETELGLILDSLRRRLRI